MIKFIMNIVLGVVYFGFLSPVSMCLAAADATRGQHSLWPAQSYRQQLALPWWASGGGMSEKLIDPQAAVDYMIAKSSEYAHAESNKVYMGELRKTIKAEGMKAYLSI